MVVIGASAGGLDAMQKLVGRLPAGLNAAVFVVQHIAPRFTSRLPEMLAAAGRLPAAFAQDGAAVVPATITVAPSDRHLVLRHAHVELSRGPRENHARPAIDVSLRSAAQGHGDRVIGVVLSGTLGDGTMGLMVVKAHGGTAIVQDPDEALYAGMPKQALQYAEVDHVLPAAAIAEYIVQRVAGPRTRKHAAPRVEGVDDQRVAQAFSEQIGGERAEGQSIYTCPDCGGVLWQHGDGGATGYRCYQGHAYSGDDLLSQKSEHLENALWAAARALIERATLNRQLAAQLRKRGLDERATNLEEQADGDEAQMRLLRREMLGL